MSRTLDRPAAPGGKAGALFGLAIVVHGRPAPQGSKRHVGRGVMVESSKALKPWREAVKTAALDEIHGFTLPLFTGPVHVDLALTFARPAHHWRTGRNAHLLRDNAPTHPAGKPDLDKCQRAIFDALTDAGVWRDDSQVVGVAAVKCYPDLHPDALQTPGAFIRIRPLDTP